MTTPTQQTSAALRAQLSNGSLAGTWTLDPARSTATLRSKNVWGLVSVKGVFRDIQGGGTVSPAGEVTGSIALATGSLDTKNKKRDTHLRSADFFLTEKYPAITFTVGSLQLASDGVTVSGNPTVLDHTPPLSLPTTLALSDNND